MRYLYGLVAITRAIDSVTVKAVLTAPCTYVSYGTAQRQLNTRTQAVGLATKGDISMGMWVPVGIFPVSSKARL